jgi:hypothetical protein
VIARNRAENVPKGVDKDAEGTTDVDQVVVAPAEAATTDVAVAEHIKEQAADLLAASLLAPNADRVPETALLGLLAGAVCLRATSLTACAGMDKPGSGATTASCGPRATERPLTVAPRKGPVEKTRKPTPISGLWPLQKRSRSFGLKPTPTWPRFTFRPRCWKAMASNRSFAPFRSSVSVG